MNNKTWGTEPVVLGSLKSLGETLFMEDVPVGEVLFTGYNLTSDTYNKKIYGLVETVAKQMGIPLPDEIKDGSYALFRGVSLTRDYD